MKKIILLLLVGFFALGCKTPSVTNTKTDSTAQKQINGNWTLTKVSYTGQEYFKVTSFDIADSQCFVGSDWSFISNNNTGNFALNNSNCTGFTSPITWYVNQEGNFVMKILNENKARKTESGYILKLQNQTASSFELVNSATVDTKGSSINIVYRFEKK